MRSLKALLRRTTGWLSLALLMGLPGVLGAQQGGPAIPAPLGMVSDFASIIPPAQAARIDAIATDVRAKSGGEIAVVTMSDLAGRDVSDVALRIGREWKVGANSKIGDAKRNAGVVILVVPKESSKDGRGHVGIQTGQGSEGFITDGQTGEIIREAIPLMQRLDYGNAILLMTQRVAEHFATNFGFALDSASQPVARVRRQSPSAPSGGFPPKLVFVIFILLVLLLSRGRGSGCLWMALTSGRSGGWSSGGGGGFGGGGGGGFGGFGGGGGFSGGGSSGSW